MDLRDSPLFHFILGTLFIVSATLTAIENPVFLGLVYWPPILLGCAGMYFYARGIVLAVKDGRGNQMKESKDKD